MKKTCLLLSVHACSLLAGNAQLPDYSSDKEKIYLQTSHVFFKPGETVYFKIYVVNAADQTPARQSGVVYAELAGPSGTIIEKSAYKAENGYAEGSFTLNEQAAGGIYRIRSYTSWMRNEKDSSFFVKEITVQKVIAPRILMKLDFPVKGFGPGTEVTADFSMRNLENQPLRNYTGKFTVSLAGKTVQTADFKTDREGKALLRFFLPQNLATNDGLLNVTVTYDSYTESIARSIPIVLNKIDLQFMPEGGTLVEDVPTRIAFKAVNENGKPADIGGEIQDGNGKEVASFQSYHSGMGIFDFTPQRGMAYKAVITSPLGIRDRFALPQASADGVVMNMSKVGRKIYVKLLATDEQTVKLSGRTKNTIYYTGDILLRKGENTAIVDEGLFPAGIAQFTLFASNGRPLAERLVFLNENRHLQVTISTDKPAYLPREKVAVTLKTTDETGKPVPSNLSLAVVDDKLWTLADDKQDHILSWLLMSSELKGKIEEPQFYFKKDEPKAIPALDLVMLTHGYRYFDYIEYVIEEGKLRFIPDQANILNGSIVDSKGNPVKATLYLVQAVYSGQAIRTATTDNGLFFFSQLEPGMQYYLVAKGENTSGKLTINILQNGLGYNLMKEIPIKQPAPVPNAVVPEVAGDINPGKEEGDQQALKPQPMAPMGELGEVVVIGFGQQRRKEVTGSVTIVSAKDLLSVNNLVPALQGRASGLTITSVANPQDKKEIVIRGMRSLSGASQPLIVIDGVPVQAADLGTLNPDDVAFITVYKDANATAIYGAAAAHGVIVIESKKSRNERIRIRIGKDSHYTSLLVKASGPAYAFARRFYAPKYSSTDAEVRDDFRETIYWNPVVQTDREGMARLEFYNSDAATTFRAIAEGIGYSGKPGRAETTYTAQNAMNVDVKIPPYLTVGDKALVPLVVKNNKDEALNVSISIQLPQNLRAGAYDSTIVLAPGRSARVTIPIEATAAVNGNIGFTVASQYTKEMLLLPVTVNEKGFPVIASFGGNKSAAHSFTISKMLPGTLSATLKLYPDMEGQLLDGIESMLREPYGCFEQTSSTTYPNIYILKYLRESGRSNPGIEKQALEYIEKGYKRLIGFETAQNGFEWFGHTPPHEALTAYGLLEFTDMKPFIKVDEQMLQRTKKFLLSRRDGKGAFLLASGGYDRFASVPNAVANIYIVYALTQAGMGSEIQPEYRAAVTSALSGKDGYQLAMMALAASNMKNESDYRQLMNALAGLYRNAMLPAATSVVNSGGQSLKVETLALYALALMREPSLPTGRIAEIISTILAQKTYYGYGSTQATVFALQALVNYRKLIGNVAANSQVSFTINGKEVNPGDGLDSLLQEGANTFGVRYGREEETIPYNLELGYSTLMPPNSEKAVLKLDTRLAASRVKTGETVRLTLEVRNQQAILQPMAIAKIGIPAGLAVQPWQLKELLEKKEVAYYEIFDNYLVFYWMGFAPGGTKTINLDLKAEVPGIYKGKASNTSLYYTPEHRHWNEGLEVEITD